jgi:RNA polymerase sigma-70 factor (ECF subfamily)
MLSDQCGAGPSFVTAEAVPDAGPASQYRYRRVSRSHLLRWRPAPQYGQPRNRPCAAADIDLVLVTRFQNGERQVFDLLMTKYQHRLLRVIARLIPHPADAEEVLQETMLRAFRALPKFRQESAFYTWLFRIGINAAKLFLKLQKRRSGISEPLGIGPDAPDAAAPEVPDFSSPQSELENKQMITVLNDALATLPLDLASPLILREIEQMSYREIADSLDCPIGTVRSRLFRAREIISEKIRPLLEPALRQNKRRNSR